MICARLQLVDQPGALAGGAELLSTSPLDVEHVERGVARQALALPSATSTA